MMLQKTVKANIFGLTKIKETLLRREYDNFQTHLRGFGAPSTPLRSSRLRGS